MSKVLIVDDDPDVLETLKLILTDNGFIIETVTNQEDIYPNIVAFEPNVILLDVNLNGSDGRNICKGLKSHYRTKDIPVILFSGDHKVKDEFSSCHAEDFIGKPIEAKKLVHRLKDYCIKKGRHKMTG